LFYGNGIQKEMLKSNSLSGGNVLNNFFEGTAIYFPTQAARGPKLFLLPLEESLKRRT
jgi:hypothetical protein